MTITLTSRLVFISLRSRPFQPKLVFRTMVTITMPRDPSTLSNYNNWQTKHTVVDVAIDFEKQRLGGSVQLQLQSRTNQESKEILLDTSYLDIKNVKVSGSECAGWKVKDRFEPFGSALSILIAEGVTQGSKVMLDITFSTTEKGTALQWLTPAQTSNKKHPYLFNQSQAIHARSIFPCQDTPDVKSRFEYRIRSPLPVVSSGLPDGICDFKPGEDGASGTLMYKFKQDIPIPSYLFAIASGDIAAAAVGPRSMVATGPEELSDTKWELEGSVEKYLEIAVKLISPYQWTQYNVLVLPPSFPYGGMENPTYTFATPSMISGDKQNLYIIAHEIGHSWSGNLVSTASWEHFWLNEGWTTYIERRIQESINGVQGRDFAALIGWRSLEGAIAQYGNTHEYTKLVMDLKGRDPDDAFSIIAYEKGYHFIYYLERTVGRRAFDKFIPHYFKTWAGKSLDSYEFKTTLLDFFASDPIASKSLKAVDWDAWYYQPGLPPKPDFDTSLADQCYNLANKWLSPDYSPQPSDIAHFTTNQIVVFLQRVQFLPSLTLTVSQSRAMGQAYSLSSSQNMEVSTRYIGVGLTAKDESVFESAVDLLGKTGRLKFVRPIYQKLAKVDRKLALETFERNREFYHPICRTLVERDFEESGRGVWNMMQF